MNCKYCSALCWHPNKGFYCTVPNCNPETRPDDVREICEKAFGSHEQEKKPLKQEGLVMGKQNEANGTASEPIARYDEFPILQTYKVAFDNIVKIGGFWAVGPDKSLYHIEMPDKAVECMWKDAKRYDIQTGKVIGYTNADRIRSMTDEELAEWIISTTEDLTPRWLDWLKEEVE